MRVRRCDHEGGFTLIEVLTVVVIIAILASILIATFLKARAQSTVAASKVSIKNIGTALETYFTDQDAYPETLGVLVPAYVPALPTDPCTNAPYGYAGIGGPPPVDYKLSVTFPLTSSCRLIAPGLSYTPSGGLVESP